MVVSPVYGNRLLIAYGNFIFRYRNKVFPIVLIVLLIIFRPPPFTPDATNEFLITLVALLVALSGEALRIATVGLEYIKRGGLNKRIYANQLVTQGLFSHCRNPLYVGNILIALGLLSFGGRWELLVIGGILVLITYVSIVAAEEMFLIGKFGDEYTDYCRRVPRWVPKLHGLGATLQSMTFNWRRVLLKELSSFYAWIVIATVIIGLRAWNGQFSFAQHLQSGSYFFLALFGVMTVAIVVVRVLKRTHRLKL